MAYYKFSGTKTLDIDQRFLDALWTVNLRLSDDECDFFCLECTRINQCVAYREIKEEWDSFYM